MALMTMVRDQVLVLRGRGISYGKIACQLGLSRNTVKSICRRANITPHQVRVLEQSCCEECGRELLATRSGQRFCTKECRLAWWHTHPDQLVRKAVYHFICAGCAKPFTAYGNANRKYCAHACYIRDRFGTKGGRP